MLQVNIHIPSTNLSLLGNVLFFFYIKFSPLYFLWREFNQLIFYQSIKSMNFISGYNKTKINTHKPKSIFKVIKFTVITVEAYISIYNIKLFLSYAK